MTKEFHRSWTVYVTSAQSHPCAIKQITFTSTYWLRYAAAVCPNMAKIQNIRPAVPTWYWSSLHELFSFHCLEWMHMNNYIKKAMFSLNTIGFFNFLRSNSATFWLACRLYNKHDACQLFFFILFINLITTQLHILQFLLFASNFIYLTFGPAF